MSMPMPFFLITKGPGYEAIVTRGLPHLPCSDSLEDAQQQGPVILQDIGCIISNRHFHGKLHEQPVEYIPLFHSTILFHYPSPVIVDYPYREPACVTNLLYTT